METIGNIRRRVIDQDSISEIARDLGLARNTVKKVLRSDGEPVDYRRTRQPRPQLGPCLPVLEQWLEAEQKLPARGGRTTSKEITWNYDISAIFVAVAEELHFARAAERAGIEQSPLSRAIKEFELDLGVRPFARASRGTQLTWPGQILFEDARRILTAIDHARHRVLEAASGKKGRLRIGFCDGLVRPRLSRLFARCRREEPDIELLVLDRPFALQLKEMQAGLLDVGFALAPTNVGGRCAEPL